MSQNSKHDMGMKLGQAWKCLLNRPQIPIQLAYFLTQIRNHFSSKSTHSFTLYLDEGHVLLRDGAVARVEVGLVEEEVVDVESPRETDLVILQT